MLSCKKDGGIVNEQLIVSKIDIPIPTDLDIVDFDVVDENIYFAAAQHGYELKLFKTIDGGKNWVDLNFSAPILIDDFQSISFIDENNGMIVAENRGYRTYNGGANWTTSLNLGVSAGTNTSNDFIFVGKTENNEFILAESSPYTSNGYRNVFISPYNSLDFNPIYLSDIDDNIYNSAHYEDGKLIYFCRGFNCSNTKISTFNTSTLNFTTYTIATDNRLGDAVYFNDDMYFAGSGIRYISLANSKYDSFYNSNNNETFTSIEKIGDYMVAVGKSQIVSNYRGDWEEAINKARKPFSGEFLKVKNLNDKYFLVSGKKGQFFKASFQ